MAKTTEAKRIAAIHEAGHAVARVLMASDFCLPAREMISAIDMGSDNTDSNNAPGSPETVTYGPTLSSELQSILERAGQGMSIGAMSKQSIADALALATPDDVERWLRARMAVSALASMAEARHAGVAISDLWGASEFASDFRGPVEDIVYAGLTPDEIARFVDEARMRVAKLMEQPHVRHAIEALADELSSAGRLDGGRAVFIIKSALAD